MSTKQRTLLESKITVYRTCYQQAEIKKDHKRMDKIGVIIDELLEEVASLD